MPFWSLSFLEAGRGWMRKGGNISVAAPGSLVTEHHRYLINCMLTTPSWLLGLPPVGGHYKFSVQIMGLCLKYGHRLLCNHSSKVFFAEISWGCMSMSVCVSTGSGKSRNSALQHYFKEAFIMVMHLLHDTHMDMTKQIRFQTLETAFKPLCLFESMLTSEWPLV